MEELDIEAYHHYHRRAKLQKALVEQANKKQLKKAEKEREKAQKERLQGLPITIYAHEIPFWKELVRDFVAKSRFEYNSTSLLNRHILSIREIYFKHFNFEVFELDDLDFRLKPSYCVALHALVDKTIDHRDSRYGLYFRRLFCELDFYIKNLY